MVAFNGINWIEKCISSLSSNGVEIVVVDNGSQDGTLQFLESRSDIVLIINQENLGFGKANNVGLEYAYKEGYDYFFLLNQDAWMESGCAKRLIDCFNSNRSYGILSPVHFDGLGDKLDAGFERYMRLRPSSGFYEHFKSNQMKGDYEVAFVNAACWLMTRECLTQVGLFHPLFKHYGEDDNYIHRVKKVGLKVGVVSSAIIYHDRADRFKKRIDPKEKFRSMVYIVHLNPLKDRNKFVLWLISMGNLFTISSIWYFLPNLLFYMWGFRAYFEFAGDVQNSNSEEVKMIKKNKR